MEIIVDYNNDKVEIKYKSTYGVSQEVNLTFPVKEPHKIKQILEEILNGIGADTCEAIPGLNISLIKIDEDNRTTVGEW